jgi:hypothetical protein
MTIEQNLDVDYEDPDENEWVLLDLPDPDSVPDNTSSFGPFYFWRGEANPAQAKISVAVTREITAPWRRGLGITVRKKTAAKAVGLWFKGRPPRILHNRPIEKDWQEVVKRAGELSDC